MAEDFLTKLRPRYDPAKKKIEPPVVGCGSQMVAYAKWLRDWSKGYVIFHGISGCGKGVVAQVVAESQGYAIHERDLSDLPPVSFGCSVRGKVVFVARGLDAAMSGSCSIAQVRNYLLKISACAPTVVITSSESPIDRAISGAASATIKFGVAMSREILRFLDMTGAPDDVKRTAALDCRGDVRNALIMVQFEMLDRSNRVDCGKDKPVAAAVESLRGSRDVFSCDDATSVRDLAWIGANASLLTKRDMADITESLSDYDAMGIGHTDPRNVELFCLEASRSVSVMKNRLGQKTSLLLAEQFKSPGTVGKPARKKQKREEASELKQRINRKKEFQLQDQLLI